MSSSETSTFLRAYVKYVRDFPTSVTFLLDKWPISKWYLIDCPSRILLLFLTRTSLVHFVLLFVILIVDLFLSRCLLYFFFSFFVVITNSYSSAASFRIQRRLLSTISTSFTQFTSGRILTRGGVPIYVSKCLIYPEVNRNQLLKKI